MDEVGAAGLVGSEKLGIELVVAEVAAMLVVLKLGKVTAGVDEATVLAAVDAAVEDEELNPNTGTGATQAVVVVVVAVGAEDEVIAAVGVEALVVVVMVENKVEEEVPKPMEVGFAAEVVVTVAGEEATLPNPNED